MKLFDFGKNWVSFSTNVLTDDRITSARNDFKKLFRGITLKGKTFFDIGFGQGLSLLCALEEGAFVGGCDINPKCKDALSITAHAFGTNKTFPVVTGSILSVTTIEEICGDRNGFDIVHSWGVLHHTDDMYQALKNACTLTEKDGYLVFALYNKHWSSPWWKLIKKTYCCVPLSLQRLMVAVLTPVIWCAKYFTTGCNPYSKQRGMEFMHDVIDWVGGYPYEYASISEVQSFVESQGFTCIRVTPATVPTGCNEFVFKNNRTNCV